jgi:hypothetical protein
MIGSLGRRLAIGSAAVALGGVSAIVLQSPALAATFSASYSCTAPVLGTQNATIDGTLTATPNPAAVGSPVSLKLHLAQISLRAPVAINSWTMTVNLDVTGAETATVAATGSGGRVPANQPITGDLSAGWTPSAAGTDQFRGASVVVKANVFLLGNLTINCTPVEPRPVGETVTVS